MAKKDLHAFASTSLPAELFGLTVLGLTFATWEDTMNLLYDFIELHFLHRPASTSIITRHASPRRDKHHFPYPKANRTRSTLTTSCQSSRLCTKSLRPRKLFSASLRSEASEWRCVMWKRACGPKAAALHVLELKWFFVQENPYASKSSKASHCVYHPFSKVLDTHQGICWHAACVAGQWRLSSSFLSFHIVRICQRFFKYQAASTFWVKCTNLGFSLKFADKTIDSETFCRGWRARDQGEDTYSIGCHWGPETGKYLRPVVLSMKDAEERLPTAVLQAHGIMMIMTCDQFDI